jgi:hypothetical protein
MAADGNALILGTTGQTAQHQTYLTISNSAGSSGFQIDGTVVNNDVFGVAAQENNTSTRTTNVGKRAALAKRGRAERVEGQPKSPQKGKRFQQPNAHHSGFIEQRMHMKG